MSNTTRRNLLAFSFWTALAGLFSRSAKAARKGGKTDRPGETMRPKPGDPRACFVDSPGRITTYVYDHNDRLVSRECSGSVITYEYDQGDFLRSTQPSGGVMTYTYDARGFPPPFGRS